MPRAVSSQSWLESARQRLDAEEQAHPRTKKKAQGVRVAARPPPPPLAAAAESSASTSEWLEELDQREAYAKKCLGPAKLRGDGVLQPLARGSLSHEEGVSSRGTVSELLDEVESEFFEAPTAADVEAARATLAKLDAETTTAHTTAAETADDAKWAAVESRLAARAKQDANSPASPRLTELADESRARARSTRDAALADSRRRLDALGDRETAHADECDGDADRDSAAALNSQREHVLRKRNDLFLDLEKVKREVQTARKTLNDLHTAQLVPAAAPARDS